MVEIVKFIREKLGWTAYRMTKELGLKSQSSYTVLERTSRGIRAETLVRLQELAEEAGIPLDVFWREFKKEVSARKAQKKKRVRDES